METTNQQVSTISATQQEIIQSLVLNGDLSKMTPQQKVDYYNRFCKSLGLNNLTQPFQIIKFQGKEKLYATKDCTDQLRKIYGVSITDMKSEIIAGSLYKVVIFAKDINGRTDAATGVLSISGLAGEALSNAIMKAESKAKRRVTLSICGLGILDESEIEGMKAGAAGSGHNTNQPLATSVETIDAEYADINTNDIPETVVADIMKVPTLAGLKAIYSNNPHLHEFPSFVELCKKRKSEIELSELQSKFGTNGK